MPKYKTISGISEKQQRTSQDHDHQQSQKEDNVKN
jgi:hypothetical protein